MDKLTLGEFPEWNYQLNTHAGKNERIDWIILGLKTFQEEFKQKFPNEDISRYDRDLIYNPLDEALNKLRLGNRTRKTYYYQILSELGFKDVEKIVKPMEFV
jgi:hypothetical protein